MYNQVKHSAFWTIIAKIILILTAMIMIGCKEFSSPLPEADTPQATNITIADLHKLIAGRTVDIESDLIIGGYVTTSDKESNFYKSFCIEDTTGGAEIMAGIYNLHNIYPRGCYLTISLNGCSVGEHYGVMQVGLKAAEYDSYPTAYFASRAIMDQHITRYDIFRPTPPKPISYSELKRELCGSIINLGDLHLVSHNYNGAWKVNTKGTWQGYNIFSDTAGNIVAVYTSDYCDYATHSVPNGKLSISGILQIGTVAGEECFMIKMSDENDCTTYN